MNLSKKTKCIFIAVSLCVIFIGTISTAYAAELAKEQVFILGGSGKDINTLDPAFGENSMVDIINSYIYSYLTASPYGRLDFANLEGEVAESWEATEDGKIWTFRLRKGIYFHDGNELFPEGQAPELTAEDVEYTFNRLRDPKMGSAFANQYQGIEQIEVLDRYTVRFRLKQIDPFFAKIQTYRFFAGAIESKKAGEALGKKGNKGFKYPIGTGPFEFVEYIPKEKVVLKANEDYFRGAPTLQRVEYRFMPDISVRTMAFMAGKVDAIYGVRDPAWIENLRKQMPQAIVDAVPLGSGAVIHFNMTKKPLDNIKVRKALAYAINRQTFKEMFGDLWLESTSIVPPYYEGALAKADTPEALRYEYDLALAKKLLAEAGYPNGFEILAYSSPRPVYKNLYVVAQEAWRQIGVKLDIKMVDHASMHQNIRKDMNAVVAYSGDRTPIAESYLNEWWHSKSIVGKPTAMKNFSHYGDVDADGDGIIDNIDWYIEEARAELDTERRNKLWAMAQMKVLEDCAAMPLHDTKKVLARQPWLDLGVDFQGTMSTTYPLEKARILKH